jgi:hypothetical protein
MKRAVLFSGFRPDDGQPRARTAPCCRASRLGHRPRPQGSRNFRRQGQGKAASVRCPAPGRRATRIRRGMAWSVDRLGRSLQGLAGFLSGIHAAGVDLFPHQQRLDATAPARQGDVSDDGGIRRVRAAVDDSKNESAPALGEPRQRANGSPPIPAEVEKQILAAQRTPERTGACAR